MMQTASGLVLHEEGPVLAFISHWEILLVLVLALLLFGGRVPKVARSLGRGLSEFKRGLKGIKEQSGIQEVEDSVREVRDQVRPASLVRKVKEELGKEAEA
jgi:TatA/E family protein of Tat protein translocase